MRSNPSYAELATEATGNALAGLREAQELSLRASEAAVRSFSGDTALLPGPRQVVSSSFDFAAQVLEQQRTYALRLTELLAGAVPAPAPAPKPDAPTRR